MFLIIDASHASRQACGVDACGLAIASGTFLLVAALIVFAIGFVIALFVQRLFFRP